MQKQGSKITRFEFRVKQTRRKISEMPKKERNIEKLFNDASGIANTRIRLDNRVESSFPGAFGRRSAITSRQRPRDRVEERRRDLGKDTRILPRASGAEERRKGGAEIRDTLLPRDRYSSASIPSIPEPLRRLHLFYDLAFSSRLSGKARDRLSRRRSMTFSHRGDLLSLSRGPTKWPTVIFRNSPHRLRARSSPTDISPNIAKPSARPVVLHRRLFCNCPAVMVFNDLCGTGAKIRIFRRFVPLC